MAKKEIRKSRYSLKVKRSAAGLGLFTEEPILRGAFVIEYFGPKLSNDEADEKGGKYLFEINNRWTIDGSGRENIARYINHGCRPNCEVVLNQRQHRIFIYAKRNIKPGEELTYDYEEEYFNDFIKPHGCRCEHCKKKKSKA